MIDTLPMPADPKVEPPLMDNVTLEFLPVLEMVILPEEEVPPCGEICTCKTSPPPEPPPLTGVKLVTLVALQVPVETIVEVEPPSPPYTDLNLVK